MRLQPSRRSLRCSRRRHRERDGAVIERRATMPYFPPLKGFARPVCSRCRQSSSSPSELRSRRSSTASMRVSRLRNQTLFSQGLQLATRLQQASYCCCSTKLTQDTRIAKSDWPKRARRRRSRRAGDAEPLHGAFVGSCRSLQPSAPRQEEQQFDFRPRLRRVLQSKGLQGHLSSRSDGQNAWCSHHGSLLLLLPSLQ